MKLIDLHCDTIYQLQKINGNLYQNNLHISLDKIKNYDNYSQFMAIFINSKLSNDQGYYRFHEIYGYFCAQIAANSKEIIQITNGKDIEQTWNNNKSPLILSVEDARILNNDITRLDELYIRGVRSLVLMWSGETCIGGSHNTEIGLTNFGKQVMARCFELGIVPDVSHASEKTTEEMIEMAYKAQKPIIASHSNSYSVYPHSRNLRDRHFCAIKELGGIVGISLCPSHLAPQGNPNGLDAIIKHIEHYMSLGGENTISFGCDLDGTNLPKEFSDVRDISLIANRMSQEGYTDLQIEKIFWRNAKSFIENNIH